MFMGQNIKLEGIHHQINETTITTNRRMQLCNSNCWINCEVSSNVYKFWCFGMFFRSFVPFEFYRNFFFEFFLNARRLFQKKEEKIEKMKPPSISWWNLEAARQLFHRNIWKKGKKCRLYFHFSVILKFCVLLYAIFWKFRVSSVVPQSIFTDDTTSSSSVRFDLNSFHSEV